MPVITKSRWSNRSCDVSTLHNCPEPCEHHQQQWGDNNTNKPCQVIRRMLLRQSVSYPPPCCPSPHKRCCSAPQWGCVRLPICQVSRRRITRSTWRDPGTRLVLREGRYRCTGGVRASISQGYGSLTRMNCCDLTRWKTQLGIPWVLLATGAEELGLHVRDS